MDDQLHEAIQNNDVTSVRELLTLGASVNNLHGMKGTPLCAAIAANKLSIVECLTKDNCDVNAADYDGEPPLFLAISKGYVDIAEHLISTGKCHLDRKDPIMQKTPLCIAVCEGHYGVTESLIKAGCDVNKTACLGNTALHFAITDQKVDFVRLLVENNASLSGYNYDGHNALHHSIYMESLECAQFILDYSLRKMPESKYVDVLSARQSSCLHIAVDICSLPLVDMILKHQSDIDVRDPHGHSPLFAAVRKNSEKVVQRLLSGGANPNIDGKETVNGHLQTQNRKLSILHAAIGNGNLEIVQMLIDHGASVNVTDYRGCNTLLAALNRNKTKIAKYILENTDVDVTAFDHNGNDCLFGAITCSDSKYFIEELLTRGCHVNTRNQEGHTVLHLAVDYECTEVADILLDNGADVNSPCLVDDPPDDIQKSTLLHLASETSIDMTRLLLFYGADVDAVDIDNETPLQVAIRTENCDTVALLLDCGARVDHFIEDVECLDPYIDTNVFEKEWHEPLKNLILMDFPVMRLATLCRVHLRKHFEENGISFKKLAELPIPKELIRYLSFRSTMVYVPLNNVHR